MAKLTTLGAAVALTAAVAQTGVAMNATPFSPGFNAIATINLTGATGTPTVKVQGSTDAAFTTPVDLMTVAAITATTVKAEVVLMAYMRLNVTAVGTAGTASAWIEA